MSNSPRMLLALLFFGLPALAQQAQAPPSAEPSAQYTMPVEAARQANPVKPTAESLAQGKKLYGFDCAMCHGAKGDGKGEVAAGMKNVTDFTDAEAMKKATDGELFYIIKNGKGDMPQEGSRAKPDDMWNLVNYIRSFAKKKSSSEEKPQQ